MSSQVQTSLRPPAQPIYILRAHSAQVHAVCFLRNNLRLASGDADGWVVLWDMPIRRAVGVWKPHAGPLLAIRSWGDDNIITHGRDNKLCVWQLRPHDEESLSRTLPIDDVVSERKQPWLLHSLTVNALNFCSFAMCPQATSSIATTAPGSLAPILVATPGAQDGYINVTSLPSEERIATIPSPPDTKVGMIMAIGIRIINTELIAIAGYESGHTAVWTQDSDSQKWVIENIYQAHTQPVLSLDILPDGKFFFTSSADAIIAQHTISEKGTKTVQTKHAGQQSLTIRSDGRIFSTAGWDGRVRVYSITTMQELAVLKWHKEGCYATAFSELVEPPDTTDESLQNGSGAETRRALTVAEQRITRTKRMHLLAAGSKDGKVSLWEVY